MPKFLLMARPKNDIAPEKYRERLIFQSEILSRLDLPLKKVITSIRTIADNVRKEEEILQVLCINTRPTSFKSISDP